MSDTPIIVIGGGWSGLSCALQLSKNGHPVTLFESAKQLGGRARRLPFGEFSVDYGQHIFLGAYREMRQLIKSVGLNPAKVFYRSPLDLSLGYSDGLRFKIKLPRLIIPLNVIYGMLRAKGIRIQDRWRALRFGMRIFTNAVHLDTDTSVSELLKRERQTENLITAFWEPLCLAALNTRIEEASAEIFIRILHETFCVSHRNADLIIPRISLSDAFPEHALELIEKQGGSVQLDSTVSELLIENRRVQGIKLGDKTIRANHIVLATPVSVTHALLKPHSALHDIAYNLSGFSFEPLCTVYLKYPPSVKADRYLHGMLGTTAQWVVDHRLTGRRGLIAVLVHGQGRHMELDDDTLKQQIQTELHEYFPHWPQPDDIMLVREVNATFTSRAGINHFRPDNRTIVHGLWLAGDYTRTGFPACIESAVRSGNRCAKLLLDTLD